MLPVAWVVLGVQPIVAQSSCASAYTVGAGRTFTIGKPGVYWFTAFTYDLPITVLYIPTNGEIEAPEALVDFQCDGPLPEDIADAIGEPGDDSYVDLPIVRSFKDTVINGKKAFYVKIESRYRNMMAAGGITRNVQAWVSIDIKSNGTMDVNPDPISRACLAQTPLIHIPETISVEPNDTFTVYQLPLSQWKKDSVRFVWNGISSPLEVWVGTEDCNFYPQADDSSVKGHRIIAAEDTWKLSADSIDLLINEWLNGGMYFVKFLSSEAAELIIERVPEAEAEGTRLRYDNPVPVTTDDNLYYFSKQWGATRLTIPTKHITTVYFGTNANIDPADPATYFDSLRMDVADDGSHFLEFSDKEMAEWICAQAVDNYVYMRVVTARRTSLTATQWSGNDCATQNSWQLRSGRPIQFDANKYITDYVYRMRYADWKGYEIQVARTDNTKKRLAMGMRVSCSTTNPSNSNCVSNSFKQTAAATTWTYSQAVVDTSWGEDNQPADGEFYYWVFNFNKAASCVTFTSSKPEEQEPTDEEEECEVTITARPQVEGTGTVQISVSY